MIAINHEEALLFNLLCQFFGKERVIPHMRVIAVCGGALPEMSLDLGTDLDLWAKSNRCLFTIVDDESSPKMVMEFFSGFESVVSPIEEEHQRLLRPILQAAGIRYITISAEEFSEILDPCGNLDIFSFLEAKVEEDVKASTS